MTKVPFSSRSWIFWPHCCSRCESRQVSTRRQRYSPCPDCELLISVTWESTSLIPPRPFLHAASNYVTIFVYLSSIRCHVLDFQSLRFSFNGRLIHGLGCARINCRLVPASRPQSSCLSNACDRILKLEHLKASNVLSLGEIFESVT